MKIFRILLVVSTALLTANRVSAQTWTLTSAPTNGGWTCVASSADGNKLVAVNPIIGSIFTSTNSGANWTSNNVPLYPWNCVASSADGCKLAAAARISTISGPFYTSTNSGASWTSNNVPYEIWFSIASSADGTKLAALAVNMLFGTIYTSTNSGTTWTSNNVPITSCKAVALSADGTQLVVVGMGICVSTNSGSSWTLTNSSLLGASAVASSADGTRLAAIVGSLIYISTNSGIAWAGTSAPATNWISIASSADGSRLVAVAGGSHSIQPPIVVNGPIYTSTNSGMTWTFNSVPVQYWTSVASSANGNTLVATINGGGIWTSRITPTPSMNITPTNGNLMLSWTMPSTNFVLQQDLDLTTTNWTDVTNTPTLNLTNLQDEVILSPIGSSGFYRLKTP